MSHLVILITDANRGAFYASKLKELQAFGREAILVDEKIVAEGVSAYVEGEKEDFQKLVADTGELWTTTNPMLGQWRQYVVEESPTA